MRRALLALLIAACGGAEEGGPTTPPLEPPTRTAAEDENVRALLVATTEQHLCGQLEGQYVALPDTDAVPGPAGGRSPAGGRWRVDECEAARRDDRLAMRLSGPGWSWVEQSASGPAGTTFTVRGHLRFRAEIALEGSVDVAFVESARVVSLWVTPSEGVEATIEPAGAVPVAPQGGWSRFMAALGGVFGAGVEERARPIVEEQGSALMREKLAGGFTFTVDLCRGQADSTVGPLGNGEVPERPYPPDGVHWLANQRSRLRAGGLDVAGPFETGEAPLHVDLEVEEGPGLVLRSYCAPAARRVVEAYLDEGEAATEEGEDGEERAAAAPTPAPLSEQRIESGASFVEVDATACPVVLVATALGDAPTVYRYRAFELGDRSEPLIRCDPPAE